MVCVRALAHAAKPIEGRYSQCGCEIAIRAAARRGLLQLHSYLASQSPRIFEKLYGTKRTLHWRTIDSAGNFHRAPLVYRSKRMKLLVERSRIPQPWNADIDMRHRF